MKATWKQVFLENASYKFVALFISLILWVTILGRRDFQVTKNLEVDLVPPVGYSIESQSTDQIKVKVSGPRTALRKFIEGGSGSLVTVDLSHYNEGVHRVQIPTQRMDLPFGVKVLSVRPSEIEVRLQKQSTPN